MAIRRRLNEPDWSERIAPLLFYGGICVMAFSFILMLLVEKERVFGMGYITVTGGGIAGLGWMFSSPRSPERRRRQ